MRFRLAILGLGLAVAGFAGPGSLPAAAQDRSDCSKGVVKDDGTVESGYGFVPSSVEGYYVQEFRREEFEQPFLDAVCVCWLKTRGDREIDFEVLLYEATPAGRPAGSPSARFPARATDVADSVASAGKFVRVSLGGVPMPDGRFFLGVRWSPKEDDFLFVCVDQGKETDVTSVFFKESVAPVWRNVFESKDPIFKPHRAILVRAESRAEPPRTEGRKPGASEPPGGGGG